MTILISLFGIAGRAAGDLLITALGWASSLLFGRVPRSHQIYLVIMMAGAFLWSVLALCVVIPSVASMLLAATPHPPFVDQVSLAVALLAGVVVVPLVVGLAGHLVPFAGERETGPIALLGDVLRGYLLTPVIAGLLVFLSIVGVARKIRSRRHGWADVHVPIILEPGRYEQLVADLHQALGAAALTTTLDAAPRVLTAPAWLLTRIASENVRKLRPDRLIEISAPDLRIGVYPSDIAISGTVASRTRARAAILACLVTSAAHMTISAEGQAMEDELSRIARAGGSARFGDFDTKLLELAVPTDEWDILYRVRLQVELRANGAVSPGLQFGSPEAAADRSAATPPPERVGAITRPALQQHEGIRP